MLTLTVVPYPQRREAISRRPRCVAPWSPLSRASRKTVRPTDHSSKLSD